MTNRRLTAVLAADIAGYSALMGVDDVRTVNDLKAHQSAVFPLIAQHGGRIIDTAGDGILAEFPSAVEAVKCAIAIQKTVAFRNSEVERDRRLEFRIGVNLGDVLFDEGRIYGDGVNIAARLEGIATPGGICVSRSVFEQVANKLDTPFVDLGEKKVKNIANPVHVFGLSIGTDGNAEAGKPTARAALIAGINSAPGSLLLGAVLGAGLIGSTVTAYSWLTHTPPPPPPRTAEALPKIQLFEQSSWSFEQSSWSEASAKGVEPKMPSAEEQQSFADLRGVAKPSIATSTAVAPPAVAAPPPMKSWPFDGYWQVNQAGGPYCPRKSVEFVINVIAGAVWIRGIERGVVKNDASIRYTLPSRTDPRYTIEYVGKMAGDLGQVRFRVIGGKCNGSATLKRMTP